MTTIDGNSTASTQRAEATRIAQQQPTQTQTQTTPAAKPAVDAEQQTRDVVAAAAVDNDRAATAAAALKGKVDTTPALPAVDANTATAVPANSVDAVRSASTPEGRAAVMEAIAKKADVALRSAPHTAQHLTMANNDVQAVQRALNVASPAERAAGLNDPTSPGSTIKVSAADERAIAAADSLPNNRGVPSLNAADTHVTNRFLDNTTGSPAARAKFDAAWSAMSPAERTAALDAGKAADARVNAPGFAAGFSDAVKDSVTGIADTAAFAAKMASDPAARAKFEQDATTVKDALKTEEGRTAVAAALGDAAKGFFAKGDAYVAGYVAGTVAAGAATAGAASAAGKATAQGLKLVSPEVVAAASKALDASKAIAAKAAPVVAGAAIGLVATSSEAQAGVGSVAQLASSAPLAAVAATALGAATFNKLGAAAKETVGKLVKDLVARGDKNGAAQLVDQVKNAAAKGTPESVIEAARISAQTAALGERGGTSLVRNVDDAIRLGDGAKAKALLDTQGKNLDVDTKKRLEKVVEQRTDKRTGEIKPAEGRYFNDISQARKAATDAMGPYPSTRAKLGQLHDAEGKFNGVLTPDGRELRVDWDPHKGLHYNVSKPGADGKKVTEAFVVRGAPAETYNQYLAELQRLQR